MGTETLIQIKTQYSSPKLSGQKVLYKGKRYWVIEMDRNLPYHSYEDTCDAIFYDNPGALPLVPEVVIANNNLVNPVLYRFFCKAHGKS